MRHRELSAADAEALAMGMLADQHDWSSAYELIRGPATDDVAVADVQAALQRLVAAGLVQKSLVRDVYRITLEGLAKLSKGQP